MKNSDKIRELTNYITEQIKNMSKEKLLSREVGFVGQFLIDSGTLSKKCYVCDEGSLRFESVEQKLHYKGITFKIHDYEVEVCDNCGEEFVTHECLTETEPAIKMFMRQIDEGKGNIKCGLCVDGYTQFEILKPYNELEDVRILCNVCDSCGDITIHCDEARRIDKIRQDRKINNEQN